MTLHDLLAMLIATRFTCCDEDELQRAVESLLRGAGAAFEREVRLSARDRVDFMVAGGIALELKVKTTAKALLEQVLRYAEHERVKTIVVGSTSHHALGIPQSANGKPVHVVHLRRW